MKSDKESNPTRESAKNALILEEAFMKILERKQKKTKK